MPKLFTGAASAVAALSLTLAGALAGGAAQAAPASGGDGGASAGTRAGVAHYAGTPAAAKARSKDLVDDIVAHLPSDWQQRRDAARQRFDIDHSPAEDILNGKVQQAAAATTSSAIDPTQYQCAPTPLDGYVDSILADVDPNTLFALSYTGALDIPTYDALLFGTSKDADHQLLPAYKAPLTSTFGTAQRFWDVRLDDVQLLAMHGEMLTDLNRVARTVEYLYGVGPADATDIATDIVALVKSDKALQNGKNPIFTLNAFAFSGEGDPDPAIRRLPDKMIFGDGILAALKAIGLGGATGVGPKAVLGHEMAHHVQYEDNLFESDLTGPEATRRTELMADAFGTYFVTHKKGLGLTPKQVLVAGQSFYDVGDCQFTSDGHHGTPNQRRAASAFGAAQVAYANDPNKVLPSLKLDRAFEKALPTIVAPDAATTPQAYAKVVAAQ